MHVSMHRRTDGTDTCMHVRNRPLVLYLFLSFYRREGELPQTDALTTIRHKERERHVPRGRSIQCSHLVALASSTPPPPAPWERDEVKSVCGRLVERSVLQISKEEMESPFSEEFVAVQLASSSHRPPLSVSLHKP